MVKSILLVGVGGQGTILTSKIIVAGLVERGYDVKMSEIHGMSQRGGSVTTQIRYGKKVFSPNIGEGEADMIISFEKLETLRLLPYLKKGGILITDVREIYPMPVLTGAAEYPHDAIEAIEKLGPRVIAVNAADIAEKLGNIRAQNIVLLGAMTELLELNEVNWEDLVARYVPAKTKDLNLAAYREGQKILKTSKAD